MNPSMLNATLLTTAPSRAVVVVRVVVVVGNRRRVRNTHDSKTPPAQTGRGFLFKTPSRNVGSE